MQTSGMSIVKITQSAIKIKRKNTSVRVMRALVFFMLPAALLLFGAQ